MIVIVSFKDPDIVKAGKVLADIYKDKVVFLEEGCFAELKQNEPVIFLGHADDKNSYLWHGGGNLDPKQLYDLLVTLKFPFSKVNKMYVEGWSRSRKNQAQG